MRKFFAIASILVSIAAFNGGFADGNGHAISGVVAGMFDGH